MVSPLIICTLSLVDISLHVGLTFYLLHPSIRAPGPGTSAAATDVGFLAELEEPFAGPSFGKGKRKGVKKGGKDGARSGSGAGAGQAGGARGGLKGRRKGGEEKDLPPRRTEVGGSSGLSDDSGNRDSPRLLPRDEEGPLDPEEEDGIARFRSVKEQSSAVVPIDGRTRRGPAIDGDNLDAAVDPPAEDQQHRSAVDFLSGSDEDDGASEYSEIGSEYSAGAQTVWVLGLDRDIAASSTIVPGALALRSRSSEQPTSGNESGEDDRSSAQLLLRPDKKRGGRRRRGRGDGDVPRSSMRRSERSTSTSSERGDSDQQPEEREERILGCRAWVFFFSLFCVVAGLGFGGLAIGKALLAAAAKKDGVPGGMTSPDGPPGGPSPPGGPGPPGGPHGDDDEDPTHPSSPGGGGPPGGGGGGDDPPRPPTVVNPAPFSPRPATPSRPAAPAPPSQGFPDDVFYYQASSTEPGQLVTKLNVKIDFATDSFANQALSQLKQTEYRQIPALTREPESTGISLTGDHEDDVHRAHIQLWVDSIVAKVMGADHDPGGKVASTAVGGWVVLVGDEGGKDLDGTGEKAKQRSLVEAREGLVALAHEELQKRANFKPSREANASSRLFRSSS